MSTAAKDTTYPQDWPAYNAAQVHEQERVAEALADLCSRIKSPFQHRGRPRIPLSDAIFCAVMKVYATTSGRRAMTDMREYATKNLISRAPHYNSIFTVLEDPSISPILKALIEASAVPMRPIESEFAADTTCFATRIYGRWFDSKYGRVRSECAWVKAHVMVGIRTKIITAIEVTPQNVHDSKTFVPLLRATSRKFNVEAVCADKAYLSHEIVTEIDDLGAYPFIPFRSNMTGYGSPLWMRLYKHFTEHPEEFYARYHKRSNVETAFSMMKAKFGAFVRSKTANAQRNEVLCKALCHNLCVLLHAVQGDRSPLATTAA